MYDDSYIPDVDEMTDKEILEWKPLNKSVNYNKYTREERKAWVEQNITPEAKSKLEVRRLKHHLIIKRQKALLSQQKP